MLIVSLSSMSLQCGEDVVLTRNKVVKVRLKYEAIALELGTSLGGVMAHCKIRHCIYTKTCLNRGYAPNKPVWYCLSLL